MITLAFLVLAASADQPAPMFRAGAWEGQCSRRKKDRCVEYEAVNSGPVTLRFRRDAKMIYLSVEPSDCKSRGGWATINPTYGATTMTYMIRGHVVAALSSCKSKLPIPTLEKADTAELLRQTVIVEN